MRLFLSTIGKAELYKDRSPAGVPRWVVIWPEEGRSKIYSSTWYTIDQVKRFTEEVS